MRYTTVIDLSENPSLYRSPTIRLVYLHLALKSGYHDHDRDLVNISIRRLAADTGLTVSAVRCALSRLEAANLISKQGPLWYVKKWVVEAPITSRPRTVRQQKAIEARAIEEQQREERQRRQAIEEQKRQNLRAQGKTSFMLWYEDLMQKAEAGDQEAQQQVKRHAETYERHKQSIQNEK